jgi:ribonuclease HI
VAENLDRNYRNRNIYIISDSQAAIKASNTDWITSKLVWNCHLSLMQLAKHNRVQLILVPSHVDTDGNKMADCPQDQNWLVPFPWELPR